MLTDFHEDLARSKDKSLSDKLDSEYLEIFPGAVRVEFADSVADQRSGIDKKVYCDNGTIDGYVVTVEEKIRSKRYDDILLEVQKNAELNSPGWLFTCTADYISYVFNAEERLSVFVFPTKPLIKAWSINGRKWVKKYGYKTARTRVSESFYTTVNVAVPIDVLSEAIKDASFIHLVKED